MFAKAFFRLSYMWQIILNWVLQMVFVPQMYFSKPLTHWSPIPKLPKQPLINSVRRKSQASHCDVAGTKPFSSDGVQNQSLDEISYSHQIFLSWEEVGWGGRLLKQCFYSEHFLNIWGGATNMFLKDSRNLNLVRNFEMNPLAWPSNSSHIWGLSRC